MKNILVIAILMVSSAVGYAQQKATKDRPNIILIMADDLGWVDVSTGQTNGGRGSKIYRTPNIDRIASQGMSFTNAYTQQNCAPTRASLISGQYPTGVDNNVYNVDVEELGAGLSRQDRRTEGFPNLPIEPYRQQMVISEDGFNIFDMAKKAGYQTALVGKSHGTPRPLKGDYGLDLPGDIHHIINATVNGEEQQIYFLAANDDSTGWTFKSKYVNKYSEPYDQQYIKQVLAPFKGQSDLTKLTGTAKHLTDAMGDYCVDYIKEKADKADPFFLYVPFNAVHYKVTGRTDLTAKYLAQGLDKRKAEYASMIELLDQNIGKINNAVKDPNGDGDFSDDMSSNTLFIVYSDNGGVRGNAPLTGGKGVFTEGGIRVPLICRWPGVIAPNTVTNQAVHCIDFYPMLAELIGVDLSTLKKENGEGVQLDGVSFAKILRGEKKRLERENLFWHFPGYMDKRLRPCTMIQKRVGDDYYKLFYYYETEEYLMYHVNEDLSEVNNLLENPSSKEKELALVMNHDMLEWLEVNNAPTGTWVKGGGKVPYPKEDGVLKYYK